MTHPHPHLLSTRFLAGVTACLTALATLLAVFVAMPAAAAPPPKSPRPSADRFADEPHGFASSRAPRPAGAAGRSSP